MGDGGAHARHSTERAKRLIGRAIDLDCNGDRPSARAAYIEAVLEVVHVLGEGAADARGEGHLLEGHFGLLSECIDRIQQLSKEAPRDEQCAASPSATSPRTLPTSIDEEEALSAMALDAEEAADSDYLLFASEPTSRRQSLAREEPPDATRQRPAARAASSRDDSPGARASHQRSRPFSPPAPLLHPAPSGGGDESRMAMSLSGLRKVHERNLVRVQKRKSRDILQRLVSQQDEVAPSRRYISKLLGERQRFYALVNEKIASLVGAIRHGGAGREAEEAASRSALPAKGGDPHECPLGAQCAIGRELEALASGDGRQSVEGNDCAVLASVVAHLRSKEAPLPVLLDQFIARCRYSLMPALAGWAAEGGGSPSSSAIEGVLEEIGIVQYHIGDVLLSACKDLSRERHSLILANTIQAYLFSTPLYPMLMLALREAHRLQDLDFASRCAQLGWRDVASYLGIRPVYRQEGLRRGRKRSLSAGPSALPGGGGPFGGGREAAQLEGELFFFADAIDLLRGIGAAVTPLAKVMAITACCGAICASISEHCEEEEEEDVALSVGSEDLLLMMAYVLVACNIPDMYSQMAFITAFVPEEAIRGESGYVLATIQTSMDHICNLTISP